MNFFRCFLICLACLLWSGKIANVDRFVVDLDSGAKFLFVSNYSFGQFMETILPTCGISSIFRNSCLPQVFDSIIRFIPINVIENFFFRDGAVVHDPYKPMLKKGHFVKAYLKIPITSWASSNTSGWTFFGKRSFALRAGEVASWPIFPKQPTITVFKTLPKVFLARNFLDAFVVKGYSCFSDNTHGLYDVVVRS